MLLIIGDTHKLKLFARIKKKIIFSLQENHRFVKYFQYRQVPKVPKNYYIISFLRY